jgi:hypothetical protein
MKDIAIDIEELLELEYTPEEIAKTLAIPLEWVITVMNRLEEDYGL